MERGQMSRTFPEELVERIVAMMPFPYIFKARVLSKAWLARLSPVSSQEGNEDKKQLAISFQKRVSEYSRKWKTFSPAFVGKKGLIAHDYDPEPRRWRRILTLSFLPQNLPGNSSKSNVQIAGALVLIDTGHPKVLLAANVLTRSWKQLPQPPHTAGLQRNLVSNLDTYKVIDIFFKDEYYFAQIYDSQLGAWFTKRLDIPDNLTVLRQDAEFGNRVPVLHQENGVPVLLQDGKFLNGVLYWLVCVYGLAWGLLAFNVKEETFKVFEVTLNDIFDYAEFDYWFSNVYKLVVWNGSLFLVVYELFDDPTRVVVLHFDPVSQRRLMLTAGPPLNFYEFGTPTIFKRGPRCYDWKGATSDGDHILFLHSVSEDIVVYNVRKDEWSEFPFPSTPNLASEDNPQDYFSFEPGLNPFVIL